MPLIFLISIYHAADGRASPVSLSPHAAGQGTIAGREEEYLLRVLPAFSHADGTMVIGHIFVLGIKCIIFPSVDNTSSSPDTHAVISLDDAAANFCQRLVPTPRQMNNSAFLRPSFSPCRANARAICAITVGVVIIRAWVISCRRAPSGHTIWL